MGKDDNLLSVEIRVSCNDKKFGNKLIFPIDKHGFRAISKATMELCRSANKRIKEIYESKKLQ